MRNWLEDLLGQTARKRNALVQAAQAPQFDPVDLAPMQQRIAEPGPDPVQALLQAYRSAADRRGAPDPLLQRRGARVLPTDNENPMAAAAGISVTTSGPRAGRAKTTVDLGNGKLANVYYDKRGRRQVMVFDSGRRGMSK